MIKRILSAPLGVLLLAVLTQVAAAQTPIRVGQTVTGELRPGGPALADQSLFQDFTVQASPGQRLVITLASEDFDALLFWGTGTMADFQRTAMDDDGGGGTNSRLEVQVSGQHTIRVNTLTGGMSGRFTLSVQGAGGATVPTSRTPSGGGAQAISAGQRVNGRLESSDPKLDDDSHYDLYVYQGRAGERITVTMRSSDFDAYLAGGDDFSDRDDDGAGGTDAMLEATVGGDGRYPIRANSLAAGETGAYTLSVASAGGGAAPSQGGGGGAITAGQTVTGRLERTDPMLDDTTHYDTWIVRGQPGEQLRITLTSRSFDTFLIWGRMEGSTFQGVAGDDDGGGGTNSMLEVELESGIYAIRANSWGKRATGDYTLSVERTTLAPPPNLRTVAAGQPVSGRLESSDPKLADDSHYDLFSYRGQPGQQVIVTLRSDAFDTYLAAGRFVGSRFETDVYDDDGGGGTNSQLVATVGSRGLLAIRANSLRGGQTGAYTLQVQPAGAGGPARPQAPQGAATISAGQTVNGTLARTDGMLTDSSFFDEYVYQGNPGDRLRITMQSGAFDTYLYWGKLEGDRWTMEATDDDGAGNGNSQLEVRVNSTGLYAIRANSFQARQTGAYTLRVERLTGAGPAGPVTQRPTERPQTRPGVPSAGSSKWRVGGYQSATSPAFRQMEQMGKRDQLLENFANQLASNFQLPESAAGVDLVMAQCGQINAFYSPRDRRITFCYELMSHLFRTFVPDGQLTPERRDQVNGAFRFIMMHEAGHALVDVMELPVTGREEDAVDQLATLMLIRSSEKGATEALAGVSSLQPGENATFDDSDFADEHSLGPVRLYNVMCWIFGSDPNKYGGLVTGGHLPRERAVRCQGEWEQLEKSWMRLLRQ